MDFFPKVLAFIFETKKHLTKEYFLLEILKIYRQVWTFISCFGWPKSLS
jgi:hypothetical protein